jgi:hypothetical protein
MLSFNTGKGKGKEKEKVSVKVAEDLAKNDKCKISKEEFDECMKIRGIDDSCYHKMDELLKCKKIELSVQNNRPAKPLEFIRQIVTDS